MNKLFLRSNRYYNRSGSVIRSVTGKIVLLIICYCTFSITGLGATPAEDTRKAMEAFLEGDTVGAMRLYRQAAEAGYAPAQEKLANILDRSELNEEAFYWYQKAAEQNNAEGQYGLGMMYLTGDGVETDTELGLQLINQAADQGLFTAMMSMYHFTKDGQHSLTADPGKALSWLERIAETGNQWAIETLVKAYRNGDLGLSASEENASAWERKLDKNQPAQK